MEKITSSAFQKFENNQIFELMQIRGGNQTGGGAKGNPTNDHYVCWDSDTLTADGKLSFGTTYCLTTDQYLARKNGDVA